MSLKSSSAITITVEKKMTMETRAFTLMAKIISLQKKVDTSFLCLHVLDLIHMGVMDLGGDARINHWIDYKLESLC